MCLCSFQISVCLESLWSTPPGLEIVSSVTPHSISSKSGQESPVLQVTGLCLSPVSLLSETQFSQRVALLRTPLSMEVVFVSSLLLFFCRDL